MDLVTAFFKITICVFLFFVARSIESLVPSVFAWSNEQGLQTGGMSRGVGSTNIFEQSLGRSHNSVKHPEVFDRCSIFDPGLTAGLTFRGRKYKFENQQSV